MNLAHLIDEWNRTKRQAGEPVMTQRRLAALTHIPEATISRHVNAHNAVKHPQALAYCRALGCTIEELADDAA